MEDTRHGGPCAGCGYMFPVGSDTCTVCGLVEPRRGDPYPSKKVERYDWIRAQCIPYRVAKAVLRVLVDYDKPNGTITPGIARIAADACYAESGVHRGLDWLKAHGWITRKLRYRKGRRTSNEYVIRCGWAGDLTPKIGVSLTPKVGERKGEVVKGKDKITAKEDPHPDRDELGEWIG